MKNYEESELVVTGIGVTSAIGQGRLLLPRRCSKGSMHLASCNARAEEVKLHL